MAKKMSKKCWNVYKKAVGGKTYDGKPLPKYSKLGTQQKGWIAVAKLVNNQKDNADTLQVPKPPPSSDVREKNDK